MHGVDLAVDHQLLDAAPTGRTPQIDLEPVLLKEAVTVGVDQRRRTNDRYETDLQLWFFHLAVVN